MARLLPPYIDKSCKSEAEKRLFNIFKTAEFTSSWTVLHSLNLAQHTKRLYGEIDFLIMIPGGGIFVMEVKGGDVRCVDGVWYFINRFGQINQNKSPFNQARDAMFSLIAGIEREFGRGHRLTKMLTGFFCSFPDITFHMHSVEYEQWQIMDRNTVNGDLRLWFEQVIQQTTLKHQHQRWFSAVDSIPSAADIDALCGFLRGDFERIRTKKERLGDFSRQVKTYTAEQFHILDQIHLNDRSLIQGSAGTGKTMVSAESAIRAAASGKRVFLTCFNRLIGDWLREQLSEWKEQITVCHLHGYLLEESKGFDHKGSQEQGQDFFTVYLPELLTRMFGKGIIRKFDVLIIDEGQDLIRTEYLMLFDSMLNGGLGEGKWEIYGDFEQQSIYAQHSRDEMIGMMRQNSSFSNFLLKINCRNTRQIGMETSILSGFIQPPYLLEHLDGIPVEYLWYRDDAEQAELLSAELSKFGESKLPRNEFIILSGSRPERSCVSVVTSHTIREIKNLSDMHPGQAFFSFATIQSFKGMEASYVIITDINQLTGDAVNALMYVGLSRAKYGLTLLLNETQRSRYRELLKRNIS